MGRGAEGEEKLRVVERLVNDPVFRLKEAATWYFDFASSTEAEGSKSNAVPHDRALMRWHTIRSQANERLYDELAFREACEATCQLLQNPTAWQPIDEVVAEVADARITRETTTAIPITAAQRWLEDGLLAVISTGGAERTRRAAETIRTAAFPDELVEGLTTELLARAAVELNGASTASEAHLVPLMERIESGETAAAGQLTHAAEELVTAARPWWALVDVLDDHPDRGDEGPALDKVGYLLRAVSVALFNHANDFDRSHRLLEFAAEIAQSSSLKSDLISDLRRLRYVQAYASAVSALQNNNASLVRVQLHVMEQSASTDEERGEVAQIRVVWQRLQASGGRPQDAGASSGSGPGPWKILGGLVAAGLVIAGIVGAATSSGDDTPSSGGSTAPSRGVPANSGGSNNSFPSGGGGSGNSSSAGDTADAAWIEAERSRLEDIELELERLTSEIEDLRSALDSTLAAYPNGAPNYIVVQYERDRLRHNSLVQDYKDLFAQYESDLNEFNRRVDAYNRR